MTSRAEKSTSRLLRALLVDLPGGADIVESEQFQTVLSGVEWFVPEVLAEIHPEWQWERLDGIYVLRARKTGDAGAEFFGICVLLSDQTLTPFHLRIQIARCIDEVSWLECRLGERGEQGIVRTPYELLASLSKRLYGLEQTPHMIDWVYRVTFGEKHS